MDKVLEKKNKIPQKIAVGLLVLSIAVFVIYSLFFIDHNKKISVTSAEITIVEGSFLEFIPVDGIAQPIKTLFLDVVQGGYVEKKFVDGGNDVKEGEMLLKLSNNNLMMEYVQKETMMYDLINNLQNSKLRLKQNRFDLRKKLSELDYQIDAASDLYRRNEKLFLDKVILDQALLAYLRHYLRGKQTYYLLFKRFFYE